MLGYFNDYLSTNHFRRTHAGNGRLEYSRIQNLGEKSVERRVIINIELKTLSIMDAEVGGKEINHVSFPIRSRGEIQTALYALET